MEDQGKRDGIRVIYFYRSIKMPIFLLTAYKKSQQDHLSQKVKNELRKKLPKIVEYLKKCDVMNKVEENLLKGLDEALEYASSVENDSKKLAVIIPKDIDVLRLRENLYMIREKISKVFGFPIRTLEKWEQGLRRPTGATRAYLCVFKKILVLLKKHYILLLKMYLGIELNIETVNTRTISSRD